MAETLQEAVDQTQEKKAWKPKYNPWLVAVIVTMAAFMEVLDTTIVNVALPNIAGTLGISYNDATWALTSYLVANGIVLTISGWMARTIGRKKYFLICLAGFTLCSLLCGVSSSLAMLVLCRLLQGFFGGGLQPVQQSIILDSFPPEKRAAAFSLTAIATIVAPVLGPLLGGWLTYNYAWKWIFFINVPFGIITCVLVGIFVEDPPWEKPIKSQIDIIGIALVSLGLGCLEIMADRGEELDWFGSHFIVLMAVIGVSCTVGAILWLLHAKNPLLNLDVLKDRNFAVGTVLVGAMGVVLYAGAMLVPQFAQQIMGYTAERAGMIMAPGGVFVILLIPIVGIFMKHVQLRYLIATGFTLVAFSFYFSARLYSDTSFTFLVLSRVVQIAPMAFLFVPISTLAFATLPDRLNGDASAMFSMVRNYLGSQAISYSGAGLVNCQQTHQNAMSGDMQTWRPEVQDYLRNVAQTAHDQGLPIADAQTFAMAKLYREFMVQVAMLSYNSMFHALALLSLLMVPICFVASSIKGGGPARGGAH
ncbi:DHA2 family efflux MFS transporter permease subunit [Acetobacteraceae bacterium]|nr:DHA2 family efflux MFS transporter permease subunit [Acetobacteraceae bacterium]